MGTLENGPGDLWPTCQVKNRRITSSHYLSASQEKRATGLRNGRRVGGGGGRLIASSAQIVCAAWRHSLASYLPTRSSKVGSRLEKRRKHWAMARDFKSPFERRTHGVDGGFRSLSCKSCRPFERKTLPWPLIGAVIGCTLDSLSGPRDKSCWRACISNRPVSIALARESRHNRLVSRWTSASSSTDRGSTLPMRARSNAR